MASVLVVARDEDTRPGLAELLRDDGHAVACVDAAEPALLALLERRIDLAIVDHRLPGLDGVDLCREVKRRGVAVISLAETADPKFATAMLDAGADDHLVKPIAGDELCARVKAVLRRTTGVLAPARTVRVGIVEIDLRSGSAARGGKAVDLDATQRAVLRCLGRHQGALVSTTELAARLQLTCDDVDGHVAALIAALDPNGAGGVIQPLPGLGHRLLR